MSVWTAPNQLTLFRLLLVPCLVICVLYGFNGTALAAFIVAGVTDALDGLIARRMGQRTTLGAWLDPMADKLLLVSTFIVLTMPLGLVISRDVCIVLTVAVVNLAIERRVFYPSLLGKMATVLYVITGAVTLFFNYMNQKSDLVDVMVYAALAFTVASGLHYIVHAARLVNDG